MLIEWQILSLKWVIELRKGEAFREIIQVRWWGQCMTTTPNQEMYDFMLIFRDFTDVKILCSYKVYRSMILSKISGNLELFHVFSHT